MFDVSQIVLAALKEGHAVQVAADGTVSFTAAKAQPERVTAPGITVRLPAGITLTDAVASVPIAEHRPLPGRPLHSHILTREGVVKVRKSRGGLTTEELAEVYGKTDTRRTYGVCRYLWINSNGGEYTRNGRGNDSEAIKDYYLAHVDSATLRWAMEVGQKWYTATKNRADSRNVGLSPTAVITALYLWRTITKPTIGDVYEVADRSGVTIMREAARAACGVDGEVAQTIATFEATKKALGIWQAAEAA